MTNPFPDSFSRIVSDDGQRLSWRAHVILILLCLAFFLPGLNAIPPVDRDEPLFAQATKQMIETGNYADIRFQEEARYKKPIGIYWLQAASVKLFSPDKPNSIWAYRVPSLIGATIGVVMTAVLGAIFFGPMAGFLAGLMMASCLLLNVEARLAKTDAALLACVMVAQYALARAYKSRDASQKPGWPVVLSFWTAQVLGFLIKGPILLLVTVLTLAGLRLSGTRLKWFKFLRPAWGLPYALALVLPWFLLISLSSQGAFIAEAAGHDMLAKIWQGQLRGIMPPGLHALVFPVAFFPASLFALLAIPDVWRKRREPEVRFLLCWIAPLWLLFEISLTKLPHYLLPAYPAIAILAARVLRDGMPYMTLHRYFTKGALALWLFIGFIGVVFTIGAPRVIEDVWSPVALLTALVLTSMLIAIGILIQQRPLDGALVMIPLTLLYVALFFGTILPSLNRLWLAQSVVSTAHAVKPCGDLRLVSASYNEPSLTFLAGTETRYLYDGDVAAKMLMKDRCLMALVDQDHERAFMETFKDPDIQPLDMARLEGPNIGNGILLRLTLYRMMETGK